MTGNDDQTQCVLDGGILPHLRALMHHNRSGIVRVSSELLFLSIIMYIALGSLP